MLLRPMTLHECRHTFASLLINARVNPKAIQEFMGHATIEETFSRYGHLMPGTRNQARKLVDAYMVSELEAGMKLAADRPVTISYVTTREKAHALLDHLPEERAEAAWAALEAVEGRDTSVGAIPARHGEQRLDPEEFERHFRSLPTDDEG